ncbi:MAG: hypothetical protein J6F30_15645 [Cellulosilyticum sp.]|nr:hypothetical protein [Cellulosilyticum sp.]
MKIYFNKELVGQSLPSCYQVDKRFKILRYAEIKKKAKEPEAWFIVRFQLKKMDVKKNGIFSTIPMLVLFCFKGFRSKYWLMDEKTNTCMGAYITPVMAFESVENYTYDQLEEVMYSYDVLKKYGGQHITPPGGVTYTTITSELNELRTETIANAIMGLVSIDQALADYKVKAEALGILEALDETNA